MSVRRLTYLIFVHRSSSALLSFVSLYTVFHLDTTRLTLFSFHVLPFNGSGSSSFAYASLRRLLTYWSHLGSEGPENKNLRANTEYPAVGTTVRLLLCRFPFAFPCDCTENRKRKEATARCRCCLLSAWGTWTANVYVSQIFVYIFYSRSLCLKETLVMVFSCYKLHLKIVYIFPDIFSNI